MTFTVPATLRPFIRSHQRLAYQAMCKASSAALKRLAHDERCIGTHFPGFTGILHPWGRQLQFHPPIHDIVPGGGLSKDGAQWLPSRANFFVPGKALAPIYRAIFKDEMQHHPCLDHLDPHVWPLPWNVHSQAHPNGQTAFTYLAPYVCKVAIANSRIVCLKDRTVTFPSRKPGSARPRTINLDAMEFIRRFLQHVLPAGFLKVRHCGCMHASCPIHTDTIRLMVLKLSPIGFKPTPSPHPAPFVAFCPPWGGQMRVIMRQWSANRAFFDTG